MRPIELLRQIETTYPVADIKLHGEQVWPILRVPCAARAGTQAFLDRGERNAYDLDVRSTRERVIKNTLRGVCHWFRHYDYVAIGVDHDRRLINGVRYDRILDPLVDEIGQDRVLFLGMPSPVFLGNEHSQHLASLATLLAFRELYMRFYKPLPVIENGEVLDRIEAEYGMKMGAHRKIKAFNAMRTLYRGVFRMVKAKGLIVSDHYGSAHAAVKAAHDLGMTVIEVQHGTISEAHYAYNFFAPLDKTYWPDYLLSFGEKQELLCSGIHSQIVPVGNFFVEHVRDNSQPDPQLTAWSQPFRKTVGVILGLGFEKYMVDFINSAARLDRSVGYVLVPRLADGYFQNMWLEPNVLLYKAQAFEVLAQVDFHSTVYSTTAIEAPSLGVRNILVDMDGEAKWNLESQVPESETTKYVYAPQEMLDAINSYPPIPRDRVIALNQHNIRPNYRDNIRRFVRCYVP